MQRNTLPQARFAWRAFTGLLHAARGAAACQGEPARPPARGHPPLTVVVVRHPAPAACLLASDAAHAPARRVYLRWVPERRWPSVLQYIITSPPRQRQRQRTTLVNGRLLLTRDRERRRGAGQHVRQACNEAACIPLLPRASGADPPPVLACRAHTHTNPTTHLHACMSTITTNQLPQPQGCWPEKKRPLAAARRRCRCAGAHPTCPASPTPPSPGPAPTTPPYPTPHSPA